MLHSATKLCSFVFYCTITAFFQIGPARYRAPEVLFKPDLIGEECEGIHQILTFSIQKSDMDLRRTLFSNIVLSGGSTLFKGKNSHNLYTEIRYGP